MSKKTGITRMAGAVLMLLLLCCLCLSAMAAGHDGKTETDIPSPFADQNQYGIHQEKHVLYYGQTFADKKPVVLGEITEQDQDVTCDITFVSGMEEAKEAFSCEELYGFTYFVYDPARITQTGEATFHVNLESTRYWCEFDITYYFRPAEEAVVHLCGNTFNVPVGQKVDARDLVANRWVYLDDDVIGQCNFYTDDMQVDTRTDEYEVHFTDLTVLKSGDYPFKLLLAFPGSTMFIPVTVHAGGDVNEISFSGTPVRATSKGVQEEPEQEIRAKAIAISAVPQQDPEAAEEPAAQDSAEPEVSGESLLADAFNAADDFGEEGADGDTSVLESMAKKDEPEIAADENNQELSQDDMTVKAVGMLKEALDNGQITNESISIAPLMESGTKTERSLLFTFPVPPDFEVKLDKIDVPADLSAGDYFRFRKNLTDETGRYEVATNALFFETGGYSDDPEIARSYYAQFAPTLKEGVTVVFEGEFALDGSFPAYLICTHGLMFNTDLELQDVFRVTVLYMRGGNSFLTAQYAVLSGPYASFTEESIPSVNSLIPYISQIHYSVPEEKSQLPEWLLTSDDFSFTIESKTNCGMLAAGGTEQFTAKYLRDDLKDRVKTLKPFTWKLYDAEAYARNEKKEVDPAVAELDAKGRLKAGKTDEPVRVIVYAASQDAEVSRETEVLILPKLIGLTLNETRVELYQGESDPFTLAIAAEPANSCVYPENGRSNIVWTCDKPEVVSVTDRHDGTAVMEALAPGKAKVTVKDELSGKQAVATVSVLIPVSEIDIEGPDTVAAGKNAVYKALLKPEKPDNSKVSWRLDVDESVASVSPKGAVKVKKDVPSGTKIVITCEAEGAAAKKTATKEITVE